MGFTGDTTHLNISESPQKEDKEEEEDSETLSLPPMCKRQPSQDIQESGGDDGYENLSKKELVAQLRAMKRSNNIQDKYKAYLHIKDECHTKVSGKTYSYELSSANPRQLKKIDPFAKNGIYGLCEELEEDEKTLIVGKYKSNTFTFTEKVNKKLQYYLMYLEIVSHLNLRRVPHGKALLSVKTVKETKTAWDLYNEFEKFVRDFNITFEDGEEAELLDDLIRVRSFDNVKMLDELASIDYRLKILRLIRESVINIDKFIMKYVK